ncbi:hypothetical protein QL285_059319 [Trifolium repens]|nr:hypothetical protein QL285_059319 [Trifolium repens]
MALSKNFIILFAIVFTLLLYISSNPALASFTGDGDPTQNDIVKTSHSEPTVKPNLRSRPTVNRSRRFRDPPSERTPCKGECPPNRN